jgi:O-methyltransferase
MLGRVIPVSLRDARRRRAIKRIRPHSMVAPEGLESLYDLVRQCDAHGVPGALVECGVWHGGAAALMALATRNSGRQLHLFDSFAGIPEPIRGIDGARALSEVTSAKDTPGGEMKVAWDYGERGGPGSPASVRNLLLEVGYEPTLVHIHEGWFQETVPAAAPTIGQIAVLHLDADWYESTRLCLEYLFGNVTRGGVVVIDDYGAYDGCRKAVDEFIEAIPRKPPLNAVNAEIRYFAKD